LLLLRVTPPPAAAAMARAARTLRFSCYSACLTTPILPALSFPRTVSEHIPRYVKIALRAMYQSGIGSKVVSMGAAKAALRRMSAREG
jgi:hypothetical protein